VAAHGFGGADCVYAFSSAGLEVLQAANQRGAVAVLDHATAPRRVEAALLAEEAERFPGWAGAVEDRAVSEAFASRQAAERAAAGLVLCGSSYVQRMVREEDGSDRNTRVVPLGFDPRTAQAEPKRSSGPLRVLFAGSEGLRKGVGYLAEAVGMLPARQVEVRVAGDLGLTPAGLKALAERVQLLGPVVRRDLDDLYRWADVLVLPSLSETFGLVMLEAMAAGLPVVATPNTAAPDVVRDGEDGYIVPVRSPRAIAEKLDLLAGDRVLWREMSASARARAGAFSLEAYGQRLVAALQDGATST
jgi:glycosyltransferase involved in cell wall biosynthesis